MKNAEEHSLLDALQRAEITDSHLLAAVRAAVDSATRQAIELAKERGARVVKISDDRGRTSVVLMRDRKILCAVFETAGAGDAIFRPLPPII